MFSVLTIGCATFVFFGLLMSGPRATSLIGASVCYVVGVLSGLVAAWPVIAQRAERTHDFGLSIWHLNAAAVLGGLAGAIGSFVVAILVGGTATVPFDLAGQPWLVVVAAAAGAVPRLLVTSLVGQVAMRAPPDLPLRVPELNRR